MTEQHDDAGHGAECQTDDFHTGEGNQEARADRRFFGASLAAAPFFRRGFRPARCLRFWRTVLLWAFEGDRFLPG